MANICRCFKFKSNSSRTAFLPSFLVIHFLYTLVGRSNVHRMATGYNCSLCQAGTYSGVNGLIHTSIMVIVLAVYESSKEERAVVGWRGH
jgi:hypothetical protein